MEIIQEKVPVAPLTPQQTAIAETSEDRLMLKEIHKFTKQTRNYMRWQMYITIVLVVLPILASLFIIPFALKSISSNYLGAFGGSGSGASTHGSQSLNDLLKGLQ